MKEKFNEKFNEVKSVLYNLLVINIEVNEN